MFSWLVKLRSRIQTQMNPPARPIIKVSWNVPMMIHDTMRVSAHAFKDRRKELAGTGRHDVSGDVRRPNPLVLSNISAAPAFNFAIEGVVTDRGRLLFPNPPAVLNAGEKAVVDGLYLRTESPQTIGEGIEVFFRHRTFHLSDEEWAATDYLEQEIHVSYEDFRGYRYWTKAVLRYQPTALSGYVKSLQFQTKPTEPEMSSPKVLDSIEFASPNPELKSFGEELLAREERAKE